MTAYEKIKEYERQYHDMNEEHIALRNKMTKTEEEINYLTQMRYLPLVGKAFAGKDWMVEGSSLYSPAKPFFVYSLPPITWGKSGMSFNPYQLPILRIGKDNEYGGEDCTVLMIDTLNTDVFEAPDVYKAFTETYEEIPLTEFQGYVNNCVAELIQETKNKYEDIRREDYK